MRRVSGPQLQGGYYIKKQTNRLRSPQAKSKGKPQTSNSSLPFPARKTGALKPETNQSSTNFTHKPKAKSSSRKKELKKYEKEIMTVLNEAATTIQRHWRNYLIRKYRRVRASLEQQQRSNLSKETGAGRQSREDKSREREKKEGKEGKEVKKREETKGKPSHVAPSQQILRSQKTLQGQSESDIANYDNGKYIAIACSPRRDSEDSSDKVFALRSFNRKQAEQERLESYDVMPRETLQKKAMLTHGHLRTSSDKAEELARWGGRRQEELEAVGRGRQTEKALKESPPQPAAKNLSMSSSILDVMIFNPSPSPSARQPSKTAKRPRSSNDRFEDHYVRGEKDALEGLLRNLQRGLEEKRLRRMLALESSLSNNLMTYRSYQKSAEHIAAEHSRRLSLLHSKKEALEHNWKELLAVCDREESEASVLESNRSQATLERLQFGVRAIDADDEELCLSEVGSEIGNNSRSVAFEEWDFESGGFSSKKVVSEKGEPGSGGKEVNMRKGETMEERGEEDESEGERERERDRRGREQQRTPSEEDTLIGELVIDQMQAEDQQKTEERQRAQKNQKTEENQRESVTKSAEKQSVANQCQPVSDVQNKVTEVPQREVPLRDFPHRESPVTSAADCVTPAKELLEEISLRTRQPDIMIEDESAELRQIESAQLRPIEADIELVNGWLLEISHFVLDNYGAEFLLRLTKVEQPPHMELWRHCVARRPFTEEYQTIPHQVFKQFEFFTIKAVVKDQQVPDSAKDAYSALLFTFHQALYDCLNAMLLDELLQGRQWLELPWSLGFRARKSVGPDHSKQCLEKAINRVSNVSDYGICPLMESPRGRDFEDAQNTLIFVEEIRQIPLESEFERGRLLNELTNLLLKTLFLQEAKTILQLLS